MIPAFAPWPLDDDGDRIDGLDLSCKIQAAAGWIDLEDGLHYSVHGESFAESSQTFRRHEVSSEWVEGTFPINAVRENVAEQLVVWVKGSTHYEYVQYRNKLTAALTQLSYQLMLRIEDLATYWQCWAADYTLQEQREFRHARIGIVRATVPRLPATDDLLATGYEV
jgi:hypothetical protein